MKTERVEIKNRNGLKLVIQVDTPQNPTNLVFIAHGQGGFMGQTHISSYAEIFAKNNFRVVRFDATHSIGESEGDMIDVTYDGYVEDLEDVISWARTQVWFQEPFSLCGHSMGAQSTAWYAEQHPQQVKYLAPFAPTVNYELWMSSLDPEFKKDWQEKGYKKEASRSKPGVVKKVGWGVAESLKKYDLLPAAKNLTMPVLFMVGEFDEPCPYKNQKILFDLIPEGHKELIKIPGVEHSFRDAKTGSYDEKLNLVKESLDNWLKQNT